MRLRRGEGKVNSSALERSSNQERALEIYPGVSELVSRPAGLLISRSVPRLTPWAAFLRRFAASDAVRAGSRGELRTSIYFQPGGHVMAGQTRARFPPKVIPIPAATL